MKIGILTYHRSPNYGALWQAYSLRTFLSDQGYDVSVIDYWPDYHKRMYERKFVGKSTLKRLSLKSKLYSIYNSLCLCFLNYLRLSRTNAFSKKYMHLTTSHHVDVCVYGSDQIWRKQHQVDCESFNPIYFGSDDIDATKRISYAASMGDIEIESELDKEFIASSLDGFDAISVRETDLQRALSAYTNKQIEIVSDPVFLLTETQWNRILPTKRIHKGKYIFLYNLEDDEIATQIALCLSKEYNFPIMEVKGYVQDKRNPYNKTQTATPIAFLSLLHDAEYVVTSAFHGVALSLCFNKQFYYAAPNELVGRAMSLLKVVGLESRRIVSMSDFKDYNIDYYQVNPLLEACRTQSQNWLLSSIKE